MILEPGQFYEAEKQIWLWFQKPERWNTIGCNKIILYLGMKNLTVEWSDSKSFIPGLYHVFYYKNAYCILHKNDSQNDNRLRLIK